MGCKKWECIVVCCFVVVWVQHLNVSYQKALNGLVLLGFGLNLKRQIDIAMLIFQLLNE